MGGPLTCAISVAMQRHVADHRCAVTTGLLPTNYWAHISQGKQTPPPRPPGDSAPNGWMWTGPVGA